jgi:hypothetical protein
LTEPLTDRPTPPSLDAVARDKLAALEHRQLRRRLTITDRIDAAHATRSGAELVSFSCNDYLGLSHHPEVIAASVEATRRYGAGAGPSRLENRPRKRVNSKTTIRESIDAIRAIGKTDHPPRTRGSLATHLATKPPRHNSCVPRPCRATRRYRVLHPRSRLTRACSVRSR